MKGRITLITASLLLLASLCYAQQQSCNVAIANRNGTAGADITVDNTAGGIAVLQQDTNRCTAVIYNNGGYNIRCAATGVTVTTTAGYLIKPNGALGLDKLSAVTSAWWCIRTTANSSTVSTLESLP